jgi:hypothetical protein
MDRETAGREAANEVRQETLEACKRRKITPDYVISRLKKLSRFKGKKPFNDKGRIVYTDRLDFPEVQLHATSELAMLLDMKPAAKHELSGADGGPVIIEVVYDTNGNGKKDQGSLTGPEDPPETT